MPDELIQPGGTTPATPPAAPPVATPAPEKEAAPAGTPPAGAAPTPAADASAQELAAYKALGLTPAEITRLAGAHRAREEQEAAETRRQQEAWARTPEGQRTAQRRETMLGLLEETLGPDRLAALIRAAENFGEVESRQESERVEQSRTVMARIAEDNGVTFANPDEKREFESHVAVYIQEDDKLNTQYFSREPGAREAAIKAATDREVARINRILIAQGATDLKTAAVKRTAVPRSTRGGSLAKLTEFNPKSTARAERKREWAAHSNSAVDAVLDSLGL